MVLSDLSLPEPKTKLLAKMLTKLGLTSKTLIVLGNDGGSIERAARNLSDVKLTTPESLNVYDVLRYHAIVIPEGVLSRLQEVWS
jgi:large subunit ribosomal protein L4